MFFGPASPSPVVRVRDVAICLTGQSDGDVEEYRLRPPIASRFCDARRTASRSTSRGRSASGEDS